MSKRYPLYKNPAAWLSALVFAGLIFYVFRHFPLVASGVFGTLAIWITISRFRAQARYKKLGYRIKWHVRDSFFYEELSGPEQRRVEIECELRAKGPRFLYLPTADEWPQKMPPWAAHRREEIVTRIHAELRYQRVEYTEAPRLTL